jgi:hypothetical protein
MTPYRPEASEPSGMLTVPGPAACWPMGIGRPNDESCCSFGAPLPKGMLGGFVFR